MQNPVSEPIILAPQLILDGLPVAILILDESGLIHYHNPYAEKVLSEKLSEMTHITKLSSALNKKNFSKAIESYRLNPGRHFEMQLVFDAFHQEKLLQLKLVSYPEDSHFYLVSLHSVKTEASSESSSDRVKSSRYALLKKNFKELKQFSRISAMREISSSLADRLNQPLTAILSYTQAMQRLYQSKASADEIHDAMERVVVNAKTAGDIIRDIRARINANSLKCQSISINHLVQESIHLTDLDSSISPIRFNTHFEPDGTSLNVDPIQFKQVILSILHNAIDAVTDSDTIKPEISLSTRLDGLRYEIIIEDNGPGIPAAIEDKLFEPFFTTKENGIGIGLSMCQHIIDLHKGSITISSKNTSKEKQSGTRVSIYLPRPFNEPISNN